VTAQPLPRKAQSAHGRALRCSPDNVALDHRHIPAERTHFHRQISIRRGALVRLVIIIAACRLAGERADEVSAAGTATEHERGRRAYGYGDARFSSTRLRRTSYSSRSRRQLAAGVRETTTPPVMISSGRNCSRVRSISTPMPRRFHQ